MQVLPALTDSNRQHTIIQQTPPSTRHLFLSAGTVEQLDSTLADLRRNGSASSCLQGAMIWAAEQAAEPVTAIAAFEIAAAGQSPSAAQDIATALSSTASVS